MRNLQIFLSENRHVLPWARIKAELVTSSASDVTFVNCVTDILVCNKMMFPFKNKRIYPDCLREMSSPFKGNTCSYYGRYQTLSILAAVLHRFILVPHHKGCAVCFSRKLSLFRFHGFIVQSVVKSAHVFIHLLKEGQEPWWMGKIRHAASPPTWKAIGRVFKGGLLV